MVLKIQIVCFGGRGELVRPFFNGLKKSWCGTKVLTNMKKHQTYCWNVMNVDRDRLDKRRIEFF